MRLLLSSFGLSHEDLSSYVVDSTGKKRGPHYRLPPLRFVFEALTGRPDVHVLLLCDRLIMDAESHERLSYYEFQEANYSFHELLRELMDEGLVELVDYSSIVQENKASLDRLLLADISNPDRWYPALSHCLTHWSNNYEALSELFPYFPPTSFGAVDLLFDSPFVQHQGIPRFLHNLNNQREVGQLAPELHEILRLALEHHLSMVNTNIALSILLKAGLYDWPDFQPFYETKLNHIDKPDLLRQAQQDRVRQLFTVAFPEFSHWGTRDIIKALKDVRVHDLRRLVDDAAAGKCKFDHEFALSVYREVFKAEKRIGAKRKFIGNAAFLGGFAPSIPILGPVAVKAAEETLGSIVEDLERKNLRWFYLISELGRDPKEVTPQADGEQERE